MNATTRKIVTINNVCQEKTLTLPDSDFSNFPKLTELCNVISTEQGLSTVFGNLPLTLNTGDLSRCGSECS